MKTINLSGTQARFVIHTRSAARVFARTTPI
jgi:hypothetical protein